jgi:Ca-activated chloride channel family protein
MSCRRARGVSIRGVSIWNAERLVNFASPRLSRRVFIRVRIRLRSAIAFLAVLPVCLAQQEPAIHVNVRLVDVAFTVRDTQGKLVTNLTKDDFEVLDDGQSQPISFFARGEELPLSLGLIIDVSGSQEHFMKPHEHDLGVFLESVLSPRDRAFLICFGNHLRLAADFSASGSELIDGLRQLEKHDVPEIGPREYRAGGTAFYDALFYATTLKLAHVDQGRRALIIFSDGEDNSSAHNMLDTIEAAQTENVVVFGIRYTETRKGEWTARNKYGNSVMARISRDTGGSDFDAQADDLRASFREIGEQLRSSYELAYHANGAADGTLHKLAIRARQRGYTVRAKAGYFSRDGNEPAAATPPASPPAP